jgi:hypothetical protein
MEGMQGEGGDLAKLWVGQIEDIVKYVQRRASKSKA